MVRISRIPIILTLYDIDIMNYDITWRQYSICLQTALFIEQSFNSPSNHFHFQMSVTTVSVDKKVEDKISELVSEGMTRVIEMNKEVLKFSKKEFFLRIQSDTPFFPSKETLASCMHKIMMEKRFSKLKDEDLSKLVNVPTLS